MNHRILRTGDEAILERFLAGYAESSMFVRANLRLSGLDYEDHSYHGEYFGSFGNDGINGVIAHYWNGNIMMQAVNEEALIGLVDHFRNVMTRPVAGILGPDQLAEATIRLLGLSHADFAANRTEALYSLDLAALVLPPDLGGETGRMIEAAVVERDLLGQWIRGYEIEALGSHDDEELVDRVADRVEQMITGSDCWVLEVGSRPVSLCGFNARLPDMVQIGPVWTPPEHRSRGFARTLVALALGRASEQGVGKAILFTDYPAAAKAYEAVGFTRIGAFRLALLRQPVDLKDGPVGAAADS